LIALLLLLPSSPSSAKIYKYQRDGKWYFTDSPPPDMPKENEEMVEVGKPVRSSGQGGTALLADYPARNAVEKATKATVAIKSALGSGSGFFISGVGHIITNKHVIRLLEQQDRQIDDYFGRVDDQAENVEKQMDAEQKRLDDYRGQLDELKKMAENESDPSRKKSFEDEDQYRKQEYDRWHAGFQRRKQDFQARRDQYETRRGNFDYDRSVAALSQTFTITLVDDTELYAHLVTVSQNYDLALLKVDASQTPRLEPAAAYQLIQGDKVYAIGNPANLRNTVTSGIFSGFEGPYLQTNAQINPGNSGGPLIDTKGRVLGINTLKKIGNGYEGLGFAIPIQTALEEFAGKLP
jgi:serine protease Do